MRGAPINVTAVAEIGKAIHPMMAEGQIEGGTAQGLGYALLEEVVMRDGRMANAQLTNYIIPTPLDAPPIESRDAGAAVRLRPVRRQGRRRDADRWPGAGGDQRAAPCGYDVRAIPATPERIMTCPRAARSAALVVGHPFGVPKKIMIAIINGKRRQLDVHPMKRLLDVLREDCGLTGTKEGCGEGECGACTVLVDGVRGRFVPGACGAGRRRADRDDRRCWPRAVGPCAAGRVRRSGGAQCGICTPGMIMAALPLEERRVARGDQDGAGRQSLSLHRILSIFRSVQAGLDSAERSKTARRSVRRVVRPAERQQRADAR